MKVLILQKIIPHYRIPIFNELAQHPNLKITIAHTEKLIQAENLLFDQIIFETTTKYGFTISKMNLEELCEKFDVVIAMFDIRWLSFMRLALKRTRKFKLIYWGIGVTTLYGFDIKNNKDWFRYYIAKKSDAVIFYTDYPIFKYLKAGVEKNKIFVAHNTVKIAPHFLSNNIEQKDSLLFLGTLYKDKKIEELLNAFVEAYPHFNKEIFLEIIGEGTERHKIEQFITRNNLSKIVFLRGAINDIDLQKKYFEKSFACVSPGQAGLTVLQTQAFGIPFVSRKDSITGGERLNIENEITGILYEKAEDLPRILIKLVNDQSYTSSLSLNAFNNFKNNCSSERMVKGFSDAITYVTNVS